MPFVLDESAVDVTLSDRVSNVGDSDVSIDQLVYSCEQGMISAHSLSRPLGRTRYISGSDVATGIDCRCMLTT